MAPPGIISLIPPKTQLLTLLLSEGIRNGLPFVSEMLDDPTAAIWRIGDALVWNGVSGQRLIAGLTSLAEGQPRIERVVNHIDSVQLGISHTLGVMHLLSMAALGVTSLSGGYMVWRLQALNKRFDKLSQAIQDLDDHLNAQNKAHLDKAVQKLAEFEDSKDEATLTQCLRRGSKRGQHLRKSRLGRGCPEIAPH